MGIDKKLRTISYVLIILGSILFLAGVLYMPLYYGAVLSYMIGASVGLISILMEGLK